MNIWYLNHYAVPPGYGGTPGRPYYLAKNLQLHGHNIVIICASYQRSRFKPGKPSELNRCVSFRGINYYQLPARLYKGNGLGRLLNMNDYAKGVGKLAEAVKKSKLPHPDLLIPSCVHPFVFPPALKLSKKFSAKLIYEVRDIWPLSLVELSGVPPWHPLIIWMSRIEKQAYRNADSVVSLLPKAFQHMESVGLIKEKFQYIPNGIDRQEWKEDPEPFLKEYQELFDRLKKQGKFIIIYTGAHGVPNALDQLIDLKKINNNNAFYHFVLIGDGTEKDKIMKVSEVEKLSFITFLPRISKKQVIKALQLSDCCFFALREAPIFKFGISPNKIGDYLMAGKPVISALVAGNNPAQEADAGITVQPYSPNELHLALKKLYEMSPAERQAMGERGKTYALRKLDWSVLGRAYADICESLLHTPALR
ncbi:MAG: glycosyltransferase family 4 protein [Candidatus Electrothrix sp. YB6]